MKTKIEHEPMDTDLFVNSIAPPPSRDYLESLQKNAAVRLVKFGKLEAVQIIKDGLIRWPELVNFETKRFLDTLAKMGGKSESEIVLWNEQEQIEKITTDQSKEPQ